jgi:predicted RNase H-like HicB family nuclease
MKKLKFIIERGEDGSYSAWSDSDKEFITTMADSFSELKINLIEATELHFEGTKYERKFEWTDFDISIDAASFFRAYRIINVKEFAKRAGINNTLLSQYISGTKNPSKKQSQKILTEIKELGRELASLDFVI